MVVLMSKGPGILGGALRLIRKYRFYFLLPALIILVLLAIALYAVGPAAIISVIYAGI